MKKTVILPFLLLVLSACHTPAAGPPPSPTPPAHPTQTRAADGMVMVHVPGGTFTMGSTAAEIDRAVELYSEYRGAGNRDLFADEEPAHSVTLDAFWIDRTEVTNAQYQRCVAAGACTATSCPDDAAFTGATQPVVCVSWDQAAAYCAWAGGRLPTEAEWEYAARGSAGALYPWGNDFAPGKANYCDAHCTYSWADQETDDGYAATAPVGAFPAGASWCGALDMAGNVWEWVQDWYEEYTATPQTNPVTDEGVRGRVLRGGSWDLDPVFLRATARNWGSPIVSSSVSGFRCVVPAGDQ